MGIQIRYGMVGGHMNAFIGEVHRKAIAFDPRAQLVAGCFSTNAEKNRETGETYSLDMSRVYPSYEAMAEAESRSGSSMSWASPARAPLSCPSGAPIRRCPVSPTVWATSAPTSRTPSTT